MTRRIVSDTSPLISLEKIEGGFDFIKNLYDSIIVPLAVLDELSENFSNPRGYLLHYQPTVPLQLIHFSDFRRP